MFFNELIDEQLKSHGISADEFSELLIRLLDYGVINREESQIEAALYDRYIQCDRLVEEYLSVIKVRIFHDEKFHFIRVFPPGAVVPGLPDQDGSAFNGGFRTKPTNQEVAVILVLRVEYEKALREGLVDDKGCVMISLESLSFSLKNLLKRSLPESLMERKSLFKRLKQLRLIHVNSETDIESSDYWIKVQPSITSFINDDALAQLYPADTSVKTVEENDVL